MDSFAWCNLSTAPVGERYGQESDDRSEVKSFASFFGLNTNAAVLTTVVPRR